MFSVSLIAAVIAFCVLLFAKGFLLQTAVALTGDPAPRFGRALVTAWLGATGLFLWSWTFGVALWWFVSPTMAMVVGALAGVAILGTVFKFRLGLSMGHAILVAGLHQLMVVGASTVVWWVYNAVF